MCKTQGRLIYLWERKQHKDVVTLLLAHESYSLMKSYHEQVERHFLWHYIQWKYLILLAMMIFVCQPWSYYHTWIQSNQSILNQQVIVQSTHDQKNDLQKKTKAAAVTLSSQKKTVLQKKRNSSSRAPTVKSSQPKNTDVAAKNTAIQANPLQKEPDDLSKSNHSSSHLETTDSKITVSKNSYQSSQNLVKSMKDAMKQAQVGRKQAAGEALHHHQSKNYTMSTQIAKLDRSSKTSQSNSNDLAETDPIISVPNLQVIPLSMDHFPKSSHLFLKSWQKQKH